jgi:hypothetical protein
MFASIAAAGARGVPQSHFEAHFAQALDQLPQLDEREQLALTLFNSSFFQDTADTRFLLLMMATETMLDPPVRSENARLHVERLIEITDNEATLSDAEKTSLLGSLKWLLRESISHTGRSLATSRLHGRTYLNKSPGAFFTYCYSLRSRLFHGFAPFPTLDSVGSVAAQLEVFVADLLAGQPLGFDESGPTIRG